MVAEGCPRPGHAPIVAEQAAAAAKAAEKAAWQAAEKAEPAEVKCAGAAATKVKTFATLASSAHHFEGKHH